MIAPKLDNQPVDLGSGTSIASPQVAGLAALLFNRNPDLYDEPEAMRAIVMASAMNNIEGPSGIPTGQELKDGAGGIDASLADTIATLGYSDVNQYPYPACASPCWWSNYIQNNHPGWPDHFPPGSFRNYYFKASKGERIRVALSWDTTAISYDVDELKTDLDLLIFDPDGQGPVQDGYSASNDNNYELVDFVAQKTGEYNIQVYKKINTVEAGNEIGLAWSRQATYLPDLRNQSSSSTALYVRNDGPVPRSVEIHYFDANGNPEASYDHDVCILFRDQWCWIPMDSRLPYGAVDSGIVGGGEDISVNVLQLLSNGGIDSDNAMHTSSVDPAFEQVGSPLYAPALYNNSYGITSVVKVFNPGTSSVNVTLNFKGRSGYSDNTPPAMNIPAHGRIEISLSSVFGSAWVGSLYATAPGPIAIQVTDTASDQSTRSYNASAGGSGLLYGPAQYRNSWGLTSGIVVQNLSSSQSATVGLTFYNRNGTYATSYSLGAIGARRAAGVFLTAVSGLLDGWAGSVRISSGVGGQALAAVTQVNYAGKGMNAYNAASLSSGSIILPFAAKNGGGRTSGYVIQNTSANSANINVAYYNLGGGDPIHISQYALNAYGSLGLFQGNDGFLPDGWQGSVVITADGPWLAAMMRVDTSSSSGAYSGVGR